MLIQKQFLDDRTNLHILHSKSTLLSHLAQRVMWTISFTWHLLYVVNFCWNITYFANFVENIQIRLILTKINMKSPMKPLSQLNCIQTRLGWFLSAFLSKLFLTALTSIQGWLPLLKTVVYGNELYNTGGTTYVIHPGIFLSKTL